MSVLHVWDPKDPNEVAKRDYDWADHASWRAGDVISTATFSLTTAAGMSISTSTHDSNTISTVTLTGGTDANRGKVLCQVVTDDGQTLQQTATILVRER